ncbi:MAG: fumarylacetoacetate hydrolase family protein [Gammaproteobacteria bacterium]|nr:fumarylacetoacetate hydrolase family protein [Gammaproteobacteria bacterium]
MGYVVPATEIPSVEVAGTKDRFPVHRIYCVGRNYAAHAREMGKDPERDPPFFFCKPADAVVANNVDVPYATETENFHHEIELVIAIGKEAVNVPIEKAKDYIYGYAVGNDLTRRDLQLVAREQGRPWDAGKAFDLSAPITKIYPVSQVGHLESGKIWLKVNNETRQEADLKELIWDTAEIVSILSKFFKLQAGDLIYTGTPAGVGAVKVGDTITGGIEGIDEMLVTKIV